MQLGIPHARAPMPMPCKALCHASVQVMHGQRNPAVHAGSKPAPCRLRALSGGRALTRTGHLNLLLPGAAPPGMSQQQPAQHAAAPLAQVWALSPEQAQGMPLTGGEVQLIAPRTSLAQIRLRSQVCCFFVRLQQLKGVQADDLGKVNPHRHRPALAGFMHAFACVCRGGV